MSVCFKDNMDFSLETRKWKIMAKMRKERFDNLTEEVKEKDNKSTEKIKDSEAALQRVTT